MAGTIRPAVPTSGVVRSAVIGATGRDSGITGRGAARLPSGGTLSTAMPPGADGPVVADPSFSPTFPDSTSLDEAGSGTATTESVPVHSDASAPASAAVDPAPAGALLSRTVANLSGSGVMTTSIDGATVGGMGAHAGLVDVHPGPRIARRDVNLLRLALPPAV